MAALITKDKALLKTFEMGEDAHTHTAAMILNKPKESVTKEERQLAKALNFGLLYGQGAESLAKYAKQSYGVEMTVEESEKHRNTFFQIYRGLREWQFATGRQVKITRKAKTPCGRIRDFSREVTYSHGEVKPPYTAALNLPIQGGAAEMILFALARMADVLCKECYLVNVIHDEMLLEVKENRVHDFIKEATQAMELAFLDVFPQAHSLMRGLVEVGIGKTWEEAEARAERKLTHQLIREMQIALRASVIFSGF